jgi:peptide methionine sulfoxide reductase MsrA
MTATPTRHILCAVVLDAAKAFSKPIVTQVTPLNAFYAAEGYH